MGSVLGVFFIPSAHLAAEDQLQGLFFFQLVAGERAQRPLRGAQPFWSPVFSVSALPLPFMSLTLRPRLLSLAGRACLRRYDPPGYGAGSKPSCVSG